MQYVTIKGMDYARIHTLAHSLGICTATVYKWRREGHLDFCWPLGRVMTFVDRETAERLIGLKITDAMGAFLESIEA